MRLAKVVLAVAKKQKNVTAKHVKNAIADAKKVNLAHVKLAKVALVVVKKQKNVTAKHAKNVTAVVRKVNLAHVKLAKVVHVAVKKQNAHAKLVKIAIVVV